ncbi:hypothetical protein JXM67_08715 [candidate division WOR-3 bacterium]|nr:hypothetical protein [candidate division WOR-3 bacterium]
MAETDIQTPKERKTGTLSKILIGALALLVGVIAGAGGFYLIGLTPRMNLEEELGAKDTVIQELYSQLDSLKASMEYVEEMSTEHEQIITALVDTTTVDEVVTLGKEVGGKWQVHSIDDVYLLGDELVFIRIDDGHVPAVALLRIPDPRDHHNWRMLWGEYE